MPIRLSQTQVLLPEEARNDIALEFIKHKMFADIGKELAGYIFSSNHEVVVRHDYSVVQIEGQIEMVMMVDITKVRKSDLHSWTAIKSEIPHNDLPAASTPSSEE